MRMHPWDGRSPRSSWRVALVGSDNDYCVTQSGAGERFDVCVNPGAGTRSQVALNSPCPNGSHLNPCYLLSFKVR